MGFDDYYQQHTHSRGSSTHTHTQTRKISVLDGWMNLALRFFSFILFFFFFPSWWYDEPKFVCAGLSFIHHLSVITTHLYYRSSLCGRNEPISYYTHIHELTYKCRSLYEKNDLLYIHTQLLLYSTHYIALSLLFFFFGGGGFICIRKGRRVLLPHLQEDFFFFFFFCSCELE